MYWGFLLGATLPTSGGYYLAPLHVDIFSRRYVWWADQEQPWILSYCRTIIRAPVARLWPEINSRACLCVPQGLCHNARCCLCIQLFIFLMFCRQHRFRCIKFHSIDNTSQLDFGTWNVYCVSNVTFHTEFKYAIKIFPSPTVFVQWHSLSLIFRNFRYFCQWYYYMWTNILNSFQQRVVTYNLPLSDH